MTMKFEQFYRFTDWTVLDLQFRSYTFEECEKCNFKFSADVIVTLKNKHDGRVVIDIYRKIFFGNYDYQRTIKPVLALRQELAI